MIRERRAILFVLLICLAGVAVACGRGNREQEMAVAIALTQTAVASQTPATNTPAPPEPDPPTPVPTPPPPTSTPAAQNQFPLGEWEVADFSLSGRSPISIIQARSNIGAVAGLSADAITFRKETCPLVVTGEQSGELGQYWADYATAISALGLDLSVQALKFSTDCSLPGFDTIYYLPESSQILLNRQGIFLRLVPARARPGGAYLLANTPDNLFIRSGPSQEYPAIGRLLYREIAQITGLNQDNDRGWWRIQTSGGLNGWVSGEFTSAFNTQDVALVEAPLLPDGSLATFSADQYAIRLGQCANLSWATANVKEVYYQNNGVAGTGSSQECPEQTTTYELRVIKQDNTEVIRRLQITVDTSAPASLVVQFNTTATEFNPGECFTLRWNVRGVREVYLQGEGVAGVAGQEACPTETTTYVLDVITLDGVSINRPLTVARIATSETMRIELNSEGEVPIRLDAPDGAVADVAILFENGQPVLRSSSGVLLARATPNLPDAETCRSRLQSFQLAGDRTDPLQAGASVCIATSAGRVARLRTVERVDAGDGQSTVLDIAYRVWDLSATP